MTLRRILHTLALTLALPGSALAGTVTTPMLANGSPGYYFACYVLNAGPRTLDTKIQIINYVGKVLSSESRVFPPGENILVTSDTSGTADIAYCQVQTAMFSRYLRVSLCRAQTVNAFAECSSAVVTGQ